MVGKVPWLCNVSEPVLLPAFKVWACSNLGEWLPRQATEIHSCVAFALRHISGTQCSKPWKFLKTLQNIYYEF